MKTRVAAVLSLLFVLASCSAAQTAAPIKLVAKYQMPASVKGRFDHLGVDLQGNRLFLAAESAHEVLVFNLRTGKYIRAITGIGIPHAIFCREDLNRIYITDGGSGALKIYDGKTYRLLKAVPLKVDADSIGYDRATHDLYIDNGGGDAHETFSMFSAVNTSTDTKVREMKIDGDTLEAMAIDPDSSRIYINNRAKNLVSVVDRKTWKLIASWPVTMAKFNVAMALDPASHRLFVACRSGAIVVFDTETGKELQSLPIHQGVDDLIFDPATKRIYAACGAVAGALDVYHEDTPHHYTSLGEIPTAPRGKNIVLVPQLSRLYLTIPPQGSEAGQVFVYSTEE